MSSVLSPLRLRPLYFWHYFHTDAFIGSLKMCIISKDQMVWNKVFFFPWMVHASCDFFCDKHYKKKGLSERVWYSLHYHSGSNSISRTRTSIWRRVLNTEEFCLFVFKWHWINKTKLKVYIWKHNSALEVRHWWRFVTDSCPLVCVCVTTIASTCVYVPPTLPAAFNSIFSSGEELLPATVIPNSNNIDQ